MCFHKAVLFSLSLTVFSSDGFADIKRCSPKTVLQSLPDNLLERLPKKPIMIYQGDSNEYMKVAIDYYNRLSDASVVPPCSECKSMARLYGNAFLKKLKPHSQWTEHWQQLSTKNKVFDILLFMLAGVSQQKDSSYHDTLTYQISIAAAYEPDDSDCQHLLSLLDAPKLEPAQGIGLGAGVIIAFLTIVFILCVH